MYSQLIPEFPYLMPALLLAPPSSFMCQSWVVNKGPQDSFQHHLLQPLLGGLALHLGMCYPLSGGLP